MCQYFQDAPKTTPDRPYLPEILPEICLFRSLSGAERKPSRPTVGEEKPAGITQQKPARIRILRAGKIRDTLMAAGWSDGRRIMCLFWFYCSRQNARIRLYSLIIVRIENACMDLPLFCRK